MCVLVGGGLPFFHVELKLKKKKNHREKTHTHTNRYILPKHPKVNFGLL